MSNCLLWITFILPFPEYSKTKSLGTFYFLNGINRLSRKVYQELN